MSFFVKTHFPNLIFSKNQHTPTNKHTTHQEVTNQPSVKEARGGGGGGGGHNIYYKKDLKTFLWPPYFGFLKQHSSEILELIFRGETKSSQINQKVFETKHGF